MSADAIVAVYLHRARELQAQELPDGVLRASRVAPLPPLTDTLLEQLFEQTHQLAFTKPRLAWALAAVTDATAERQGDLRLQALAAFNLARAANAWVQPQRVQDAAERGKALFLALGQAGWAAACDWQRYAVPWACNNFQEAATMLEQALAGMAAPEVAQWRAECRLSLAFARILLTEYETALAHIDACETHFRRVEDDGALAVSLTYKASCLRRKMQFEEAIEAVGEALRILSAVQRPLDLARAQFQLGQMLVLQGVDYRGAEGLLQQARVAFEEADVALWAAQCHNALARLFRETGRVTAALDALQEALHTFRRFPILGLRADTLLDSAVFSLRTGKAQTALDFLAEAETIYRQLQVWDLVAACHLYRGETYAELGRYQLALHYLELAYGQMRALDRPARTAEAALRLGEAWLLLDRPAEAIDYLQHARAYYEEIGHTSFLAEIYSLLSAARLRNGDDVTEIIAAASDVSRRLEPHGVQPYLALLQRFSGEAHLACGEPEEALRELQAAVAKFERMSMDVEVAECCLPLGRCYLAMGQIEAAKTAWQRALALSQETLPEIGWRAHEGLALLAEEAEEVPLALAHYAEMVAAFARLRRWFWQPSLAGAYLNRAGRALDSAVMLAGAEKSPLTLKFVEESKAQTMNRQLRAHNTPGRGQGGRDGRPPAGTAASLQQRVLADDIRWLQQEITSRRHSGKATASWTRLQSDLVGKVKRFETIASRSERQSRLAGHEPSAADGSDAAAFRRAAKQALGDAWLALDFYVSGDAVVCVVLTPAGEVILYERMSSGRQRALDLLTRSQPAATMPEEELTTLASWLLPWRLLRKLTPEDTLIISPHRRLHRLPWAALPDEQGQPLVSRCIPLLTPSLHSFSLLQRRKMRAGDRRAGCAVAVSDFGQRRTPLAETQREAASLERQMGAQGQLLSDEQATWAALCSLTGTSGLADYAFLHIASHAFYDAVTGRASGLAFYDRDVWLDELWELAPLPSLVSLSACSGMQSYLYEGDEPIGLAATCLQAGAQQVVGSLWPVRDEHAAEITTAFYEQFFAGSWPARALAQAQRQAIVGGGSWRSWAPFVCVGTA